MIECAINPLLNLRSAIIFISVFILATIRASGQENLTEIIDLSGYWKFTIGDNARWSRTVLDDANWEKIRVPGKWESQGFHGYDGYAWYRTTFDGQDLARYKGSLTLMLGYIDDIDQVYLNGELIGATGSFPPYFSTAYNAKRIYHLPDESINFNQENTIAVRVFDTIQDGGIVSGDIGIYANKDDEQLAVNLRGNWKFKLLSGWRIGSKPDFKVYNDHMRADRAKGIQENWENIMVPMAWDYQGFKDFDGGAVYQREFTVPASLRGESLILMIGAIDDQDWVFLNGKFIGHTYGYDRLRAYTLTPDMYNIGGVNVLTIYVEDSTGFGGITHGPVGLIQQINFTRFIRWR